MMDARRAHQIDAFDRYEGRQNNGRYGKKTQRKFGGPVRKQVLSSKYSSRYVP